MNKDFEKELKQYAKDQTPDLWSRIEAGVDKEMRMISLEKKRKAQNIRFFTSLAACVAAILLTIPVYRYVTGNNSDKNADTAQMEKEVLEIAQAEEDSVTEEAAPEAIAVEEPTEEMLPIESVEEITLEENPQAEISHTEQSDVTGNSDKAGEPEETDNTQKPEAEETEETEPEDDLLDNPSGGDNMTALTTSGGCAYENITVTLSSIDANGYLLMTVVSDPSGKFVQGSTVLLDVSMMVENTWTIGGQYIVSFGEGKQTQNGVIYEITAANVDE